MDTRAVSLSAPGGDGPVHPPCLYQRHHLASSSLCLKASLRQELQHSLHLCPQEKHPNQLFEGDAIALLQHLDVSRLITEPVGV